MILNEKNKEQAKKFFSKLIDIGVAFKLQDKVTKRRISEEDIRKILEDFPLEGKSIDDILDEFNEYILPYCTNFSSKKFLGFPDTGNSIGAIGGGILSNFLQQNLINQSFCAPSATFIEIAVIQWLREILGYQKTKIKNIWDVGGIITPGGTVSNTVAMMLARENKMPGTMEKGIKYPNSFKVIVPKDIGHYSIKSGQMWVGCGNYLIEVETNDFRYDIGDLKKKLIENKGDVMALVAYVGDSRTMTVDNLNEIADIVRSIDDKIWLHADACHGFSLGFSEKLRHKIKGIEKFDSISTDPHKVMLVPYTLSALLVKNPEKMKTITSLSDLIMQEQYAFGQITPFLGSKEWKSLKLWFMMKNFGRKGLDNLITKRHELAQYLAEKLDQDKDFVILNKLEINSVAFFYTNGGKLYDIEEINEINKAIHSRIMQEGKYHIHQFSIPDRGLFRKGEIVYPLRFMCGNPNVTEKDIDEMIQYIRELGRNIITKNTKNYQINEKTWQVPLKLDTECIP